MLGFHPQHHVGFQVDPGQQQRPDELVLAGVVEVQAELVVAERLGEHPGPGSVAVGYRLDQRGHQVALAPEHPVDDDHVVSVGPRDGGRDGHEFPLWLVDVVVTACGTAFGAGLVSVWIATMTP